MYRKNKNNWVKHLDFMILDLICLQVAFFLAYTLRHRTVNLYTNYIYANLSIVLILIDVCLLIFLNTLKNVLKRGYLVEFIATIKHVAIVELVAVLYLFSVKDAGNFSRITFFLMALFYGLLTYGTRLLWKKHILRTLHLKQNKSVLVITNFDRLSQVEKDIRAKRYVMFQISGVAVTGNMPEDHPTEIAGIPLVAAGDYVVEYLCREWVDEVFVNLPLQSAQLDDLVRQLNEMGITVHIQLADKLMVGTQRQFVERLGGYTVLTTSINTISTGELFVKRLFDIIGGLVGCVLTGILFLFLAPAIKIQSPGPVFFSQIRVGKNGKKFKLYKFRSMYTDAEERKAQLATENRVTDGLMFKLDFDPRIIGCRQLPDGTVKKGIGNFIRDWSFDEFPQFWNVLKGDMSLVGILQMFVVLALRACIHAEFHTASVSRHHLMLDEVFLFIQAHLTEELTLERLEKEFFVSREHIAREFKRHTGQTVHRYIVKARLDRCWHFLYLRRVEELH